jgi:hypothetical protein
MASSFRGAGSTKLEMYPIVSLDSFPENLSMKLLSTMAIERAPGKSSSPGARGATRMVRGFLFV